MHKIQTYQILNALSLSVSCIPALLLRAKSTPSQMRMLRHVTTFADVKFGAMPHTIQGNMLTIQKRYLLHYARG